MSASSNPYQPTSNPNTNPRILYSVDFYPGLAADLPGSILAKDLIEVKFEYPLTATQQT